jgi:hypothetical protein
LVGFFDKDLLQLFAFERFVVDQTIPFGREGRSPKPDI